MSKLRKTFLKNQIQNVKKKAENQWQNAAYGQETAIEKRKVSFKQKLGLEWTMTGMGKPFMKKKNRS